MQKNPVKIKVDFEKKYVKIIKGSLWDAFHFGSCLRKEFDFDWYYVYDNKCYKKFVIFIENEAWTVVDKMKKYIKENKKVNKKKVRGKNERER